MKIIALLPVKNEAWVLRHCLSSLSFCDEILAIDDNSTDGTRSILEEFKCTILPFDTSTDIGWKEHAIRSYLVDEARKREATHLVAIDGDEAFSDRFIQDARALMMRMKPGESFTMPWVDVTSPTTTLTTFIPKAFVLCDDQKNNFKSAFIHVPRVPYIQSSTIMLDLPYAVLHFQLLNRPKHEYKKIWYMMSEFEKGTRTAFRINTTYTSINYTEKAFDITSLYHSQLPNQQDDHHQWHREKVYDILRKKGTVFFEPLDMWYLPDLKALFIKENKRQPRVKKVPNFIKKLNSLKNKIKL